MSKIEINKLKYPNVYRLIRMCENKIDETCYKINSIDVMCVDENCEKKEQEYYKRLGLVTTVGGDCSRCFKNHMSNGFPPTTYGWTSVYLNNLQEDAVERLEYFLKNNIMKPFRMDAYNKNGNGGYKSFSIG